MFRMRMSEKISNAMPMLNDAGGDLDMGKVAVMLTVGTLLLLATQIVSAKLLWAASPAETAKVCAITMLGLIGAGTFILLAPLFPVLFIGSHLWVMRQRA